ncbi:uncharacterized protein LOC142921742 [Petromyzon marinus]|uniref:uncharacterized protein LOC142921742 n=1 Tax=Petromyzon marinus TaxID=7757 RepID=UPI003F708EAC
MLLQAQANITEQHQPRQSTPPPPPLPLDGQENKDHVSRTYNSLRCEMNKLNMWKVRVHSELSKKEEAVRMAQETADALQKSTRQTQLENVHLSAQLQDVIDIKGDLMEKIRATRQMCDDLKGQSSSVQQTLTRAETEQEEVEAVHSSLKAELKTFAVTFSELNLKSQNDKNIALGKVEAAVEEMERARWDFVNKLTIKESQAKEMSELLELKNEELKMASQKLQDSIESCVRLEETERNFQARLEQMQKESGTLKLEVNRRREIESTLQAGMQNAERSFAEKEREFTASTAGQRLSCDKLQHERRDLNVIVQNLEKANEELTAAASQRRSEEAEIRSRLERNIREKNTEIGNLKIASDNNDMKHRETLESLDAFKRERASLQEAVCQMEQRIAAMETLKNESKSELNGAKAKERVLENDLRDALNAVNVLESELSQEREGGGGGGGPGQLGRSGRDPRRVPRPGGHAAAAALPPPPSASADVDGARGVVCVTTCRCPPPPPPPPLRASKLQIVGMKGLGAEVKNLILAGVKSVTFLDNKVQHVATGGWVTGKEPGYAERSWKRRLGGGVTPGGRAASSRVAVRATAKTPPGLVRARGAEVTQRRGLARPGWTPIRGALLTQVSAAQVRVAARVRCG